MPWGCSDGSRGSCFVVVLFATVVPVIRSLPRSSPAWSPPDAPSGAACRRGVSGAGRSTTRAQPLPGLAAGCPPPLSRGWSRVDDAPISARPRPRHGPTRRRRRRGGDARSSRRRPCSAQKSSISCVSAILLIWLPVSTFGCRRQAEGKHRVGPIRQSDIAQDAIGLEQLDRSRPMARSAPTVLEDEVEGPCRAAFIATWRPRWRCGGSRPWRASRALASVRDIEVTWPHRGRDLDAHVAEAADADDGVVPGWRPSA